jgi:ABC-type transport system substrate-binding protein
MRGRVGLCAVALLMVTACQSQISTPSPEILRMSIARDPISFDPTQIHQPNAELGLIRNLFDGLYRFDNNLKEVLPPTSSTAGAATPCPTAQTPSCSSLWLALTQCSRDARPSSLGCPLPTQRRWWQDFQPQRATGWSSSDCGPHMS